MPFLDVYDRTFDEDVPLSRDTRPRDDQQQMDEQLDHPDADTHNRAVSDESTGVDHEINTAETAPVYRAHAAERLHWVALTQFRIDNDDILEVLTAEVWDNRHRVGSG